jgi:hypothetical protein
MGKRSFSGRLAKGVLLMAAGAFVAASALPANAASLNSANGSSGSGVPSGNFLFTYYDIGTPEGANPHTATPNFGNPNGDNVIRIVQPNGCGNDDVPNPACGSQAEACAMFYVFDDNQEMGECCGCPTTPNVLLTFSVRDQLVNNWALSTQNNGRGTIVVVGSGVTDPSSGGTSNGCGNGDNPACQNGCSPTITSATAGSTNLDGSITHDLFVAGIPGLTETALTDQGEGETINNAYLVAQCGALIGNGSKAQGFCSCGSDFF